MADGNDDSVIAALNQEISRLNLAVFAGATMTGPPTTLSITRSLLVSRYPVPPVLFYTSLLFIYSLIVLGICIWASTIKTPVVIGQDGSKATSLELGQALLADPLMWVGLMFPKSLKGVDGTNVVTDSMETFAEGQRGVMEGGKAEGDQTEEEEENSMRLRLGLVMEGEKAGMVFGVASTESENGGLYRRRQMSNVE